LLDRTRTFTTSITLQPNFILDSSLVYVRAFDIERVTVSFSPCIGGDDELLVTHIELTHRGGCKIHGGDEVGWVVGSWLMKERVRVVMIIELLDLVG